MHPRALSTQETILPAGLFEGRKVSAVLIILLLSLGLSSLQVYYYSHPLEHFYSDMKGYVERGWNFGNAMPLNPFQAFFAPGTSVLLGVLFSIFGFSSGLSFFVFLQILWVTLANLATALSAAILSKSEKVFFFVLAACVLYWPFHAQASFFMAESLFSFLLSSCFLLFLCGVQRHGWHQRGQTLFRHGILFACIGLLSGCTALVKGQGLSILLCVFIWTVILKRGAKRLVSLSLFSLFAALPFMLQFTLNSVILDKPSFFISANDAYNTYLGQSRRAAVGCLDTEENYFFIFHNNNAGLPYRFLPIEILPTSILDRSFFKERTRALWHNDFSGQIVKSLHNLVEVFELHPRWPQRNVASMIPLERYSLLLTYWLLYLPLLFTIAGALLFRRYTRESLLCLTPLLAVLGILCITMGQPRYLIPFHYLLFPLAAFAYRDLGLFVCKGIEARRENS